MRDDDHLETDDTTTEAQQPQKAERTPEQWGKYWNEQIRIAEREHKPYWEETAQIVEMYRNAGRNSKMAAGSKGQRRRFNVLFANVETMKGAVFARSGKPDIRQRWNTGDKGAKIMAEVLERSVSTSIDTRGHEIAFSSSVLTGLLAGRAVVRVDYEAEVGEIESPFDEAQETPQQEAVEEGQEQPQAPQMPQQFGQPPVAPLAPVAAPMGAPQPGQQVMGGNGGPPMMEATTKQTITKRFVRTTDFLHNPAHDWNDVWWVAFRWKMTRDDMRENSFQDWKSIKLGWMPVGDNGQPDSNASDHVKRAEGWEIWDKATGKRFWLPLGATTVARMDDDPYGLEQFFPCPEPMCMIPGSGSVIPSLEFWQYSVLAEDLEETNNRIATLTKALKRRGVRDKSIKELDKLSKANDNEFIAVENYSQLLQKGGLKNAFETEDIAPIAAVLVQLHQSADMIEAKIDKMTGIADIMRGEGSASETATQSNIKAQYGGVRIKTRQREVERFIRDSIRIEAELIAEHFEPATLKAMTGIDVPPEVMQQMRSDRIRHFAIDIESDSTVQEDAQGNKQAVAEVVQAAVPLIDKAIMDMQAAPEMAEVIFEMLTLTLRSLKGGRQIEDVIDKAREQMNQRLQQQAQQPQQDPAAMEAKAAQAAEQAKTQAAMQLEQIKGQVATQLEQLRAQTAMQGKSADAQLALQIKQMEIAEQARATDAKLAADMRFKAEDLEIRREELAIRREEIALKIEADKEKAANDNAAKMRGHDIAQNTAELRAMAEAMKANSDREIAHVTAAHDLHNAHADRDQADRHHAAQIEAKPTTEAAE
jgi:hypothetical protein